MRIDHHVTPNGAMFLATSEYSEGPSLKSAGFRWHPEVGPGCYEVRMGRPCPACHRKVVRQWWTRDAASASRFMAYLTPEAREALTAPEAQAAITAAVAPPSIPVEYHPSGFWYARPPRGADGPLRAASWTFCGDDPSYKSSVTSPAWKAGIKIVWWSAAAAQVEPFRANCTPAALAALDRAKGDALLSRAAVDVPEGAALLAPEAIGYRPFQASSIRYACGRKATLLGDEPGLGKTIQAIGVVNNTPEARTVLVLAPKSLLRNWAREFAKWSTRKVEVFSVEDPPSLTTFDNVPEGTIRVFACNPAQVILDAGAPFIARTWDVVVVDEAHEYKGGPTPNPKTGYRGSKRSEAVFGETGLWQRATMRLLVLTGTPVINNAGPEAWPLFRACAPTRWPTFWAYVKEHFNKRETRYGMEFELRSDAALQQSLRETCMVRRVKSDVLSELAPKVRVLRPIASDGEVAQMLGWNAGQVERRRAVLAQAEVEQMLALANATCREDVARAYEATRALLASTVEAFEEASSVRHRLGALKVPYAVERIRELQAQRGKVVVFAHHKETIDALRAALDPTGRKSIRIDGSVAAEERQEMVDAFQGDDRVQLAFLSIRAAGVGLTLTAASTVVFVEFDWTAAAMTQAEDRCHRIGQSEEVLIEYLVFDGTFDAHMCAALAAKEALAYGVLDAVTDAPVVAPVELGAKPRDLSQIVVPVAPATRVRASSTPSEDPETRRANEDAARIARRRAGLPEVIPVVPEAQKVAALGAVRLLASMDPDKASEENSVGFSKSDVALGHALARKTALTDAEALICARLATIYRRQLGKAAVVSAGGTWETVKAPAKKTTKAA